LSGKAFRYVFLDIQVKAETVLNQLRDKGLVALDKTSHAQEGGEVALTPKGIECYQELARQAEAFDRIFEALGEAQARELNVLLDQMRGEDE
jgi:DNA-binding MarR family transcriptional regulator